MVAEGWGRRTRNRAYVKLNEEPPRREGKRAEGGWIDHDDTILKFKECFAFQKLHSV